MPHIVAIALTEGCSGCMSQFSTGVLSPTDPDARPAAPKAEYNCILTLFYVDLRHFNVNSRRVNRQHRARPYSLPTQFWTIIDAYISPSLVVSLCVCDCSAGFQRRPSLPDIGSESGASSSSPPLLHGLGLRGTRGGMPREVLAHIQQVRRTLRSTLYYGLFRCLYYFLYSIYNRS